MKRPGDGGVQMPIHPYEYYTEEEAGKYPGAKMPLTESQVRKHLFPETAVLVI